MALLHKRIGYTDYSENIYQYALQTSEDKLSLLNNYHSLLIRLGKNQQAKKIEAELETYNDPNPFKWFKPWKTLPTIMANTAKH